MNPEDVHSCNPVSGDFWSYKMLYIDISWLIKIQSMALCAQQNSLFYFSMLHIKNKIIYDAFQQFYNAIVESESTLLIEEEGVNFFTVLFSFVGVSEFTVKKDDDGRMRKAYEYIAKNYKRKLSVYDIAKNTGVSEFYLIHGFKKRFGITPHAISDSNAN
nr:AraC family transcriptional regulator [Jejubacter calystegiae]